MTNAPFFVRPFLSIMYCMVVFSLPPLSSLPPSSLSSPPSHLSSPLSPPPLSLSPCRVPKSYGIFSFSPHPNLIPGAVAPSSLQVAPASHRRAIVVSKDKKAMFVTSNGGKTWVKVLLPSSGFDVTDDLYISEVSPDHMILAAGTEVGALLKNT